MLNKMPIVIMTDALLSVAAVYAGYILRFHAFRIREETAVLTLVALVPFVLVVMFSSFLLELYDEKRYWTKSDTLVRVFIGLMLSFVILSAIYYLLPFVKLGRGILVLSLCAFGAFQFLWHIGYSAFMHAKGFARKVLVLGAGAMAQQIGSLIAQTNHQHVLIGYHKCNCASESICVPLQEIVGNGNGLLQAVEQVKAQKIVVSMSEQRGTLPIRDMLSCKLNGVEIVDAPTFYEEMNGKLLLENIRPSWFIFSNGFRITPAKRVNKRVIDFLLAIVGMFMSAPLLPVIALAIKIDSKGPVFFKQVRVGEREKPFVLYKFRTMREDAESTTGAVWAQKSDDRITRVGKVLRKSRLDEIPQIYNVVKGEMSLIGPRPERPEFVEKLKEIIPYYSERHFVKPGITGWAQTKYPYGASVEDAIEKLRFDLFYIKKLSFFFDLLIILETIKVVLFGRGSR